MTEPDTIAEGSASEEEKRPDAPPDKADQQREQSESQQPVSSRKEPAAEDRSDAAPRLEPPDRDDGIGRIPSDADRSFPESVIEALRPYQLRTVRSRGSTAIGDNALAVSLTLGETEGRATFWAAPRHESLLDEEVFYHPTNGDHELDRRLRDQHVIYLYGTAGAGRYTTAMAALVRRYAKDRIVELESATRARLADLTGQQGLLRKASGHLVRVSGYAADRTELSNLESVLRHRGSTLIVVGEPPGQHEELGRYLVQHKPPDLIEVYLGHLRIALRRSGRCVGGCPERTGCDGGCLDRYLDMCRRSDPVREALSALYQPQEAVQLARSTSDELPPDETALLAMLATRSSRRQTAVDLLAPTQPERRPEVDGHDPQVSYVRAFRLAYALFVDCPLSMVADAADRLLTLLEPVDRAKEDPEWPRRTWDRIGLPLSELVPAQLRGEAMSAEPEAVGQHVARLRDRHLLGAMLDVAWTDYPSSHTTMLRWLTGLARDDRAQMRQRAAAAAVLFARFDFDRIKQELISNWALGRHWRPAQAAALALVNLAQDRRFTVLVADIVHRWALRTEANPYAHDAAARTYATGLAGELPVEFVLDDLKLVGSDPKLRVSPMVALAISQLAAPTTVGTLVGTLSGWLETDNRALTPHVARSVIALAAIDADPGGRPRPLLLTWVGNDPDHRPQLVRLLREAILLPTTAMDGWRAVARWVVTAEGDDELADVLVDLMRDLWSDRPVRIRARFQLTRVWRYQMPTNPVLDRLLPLTEEG